MFKKLFHWSGRSTPTNDEPAARITHDSNEIGSLLQNYFHTHQLIHLYPVKGSNQRQQGFQIQISWIDTASKQFAVIAIQSQPQLTKLKNGTLAEFRLSHQGIRHRFKANSVESAQAISGNDSDRQEIRFSFPEGIERKQLRNAFRVAISQAHPIGVLLTLRSSSFLEGQLWDLSATGIRVAVRADLELDSGESYQNCRFDLPHGYTVSCSGTLKHWHYNHRAKITFMGIQLADLSGADQRELNRYVTELQRKQMMYVPGA